jgi:hypothetical protein
VSTGFFVNYTTAAVSAAAPYGDDDGGGFLATAGGRAVVILVPVVAIVVAVVAVRRRYALQDALDGEAPSPLAEDDGGLTLSTSSARAGRRSRPSKSRRPHHSDRAAAPSDAAELPVDQQLPHVGTEEMMHRVSVLDSGLPLVEAHESLLNDDAHGAAPVPNAAEPFAFL